MADIANRYERAHTVAEEDSLRRQVILRQRKISANLKINNLEKQIKHQKTRPSTISEATEEQISNLNTTVKDLDAQLHETQLSRMDVAKEIDQQRVSEIQALQQLGALQDETPKKKSLEELGMPSHIAQPKMKPPSRAKSTKVRHSWNPSAINSTLLGQLAVSNPEIYSNGLLSPAFEQARECEKLGKRTHSECLKIDADLEHEIQLFTRLAQGYFKKIGRDDSFEEFLSMIKDPTCSESQMI
ncbi:unnamed protein product [Cyprideis torosa]|uniref:Uncharacterized protein n=1 Tax=Cyprideis torosa TaxID=163714 RepID=A0A7R8WSF6_9CRUS|nr:unnamed protein product [Cyprideis torosa]CAG0905070.1 unnamed protein product [Cyprideis torosa]